MKKQSNIIKNIIVLALFFALGYQGYKLAGQYIYENAVLRQIITRLEADSRAAEVLVTGVNYSEAEQKTYTTIKFLEYDSQGNPLEPKYFTFSGNIIQFQSLVVRFDDLLVRQGDRLKGKSVYLFWKVFMLDGKNTREYDITKIHEVPQGYKLDAGQRLLPLGGPLAAGRDNPVETRFWARFWEYALDPSPQGASGRTAKLEGIKNAQIEAPGTMFVPGILYTIKIEHDGGLRIDASPLAGILRGEKIPF
ncbi:MAG: hypothetical protein HY210_07110 [Candidatus Omnitrophica bacterium]|nr:hypothetical protein [Candidatus Omnitrophota bacterium]